MLQYRVQSTSLNARGIDSYGEVTIVVVLGLCEETERHWDFNHHIL